MLLSVIFRMLRIIITSIVCSLPIFLLELISIRDSGVLFISFLAFVIASGIDAYFFSVCYWKRIDYFYGQLIPLVIYIIVALCVYHLFQPIVFNLLFLPFRFLESFGFRTIESIFVIALFLIIIITILRFLGVRTAKIHMNMYEDDYEEI